MRATGMARLPHRGTRLRRANRSTRRIVVLAVIGAGHAALYFAIPAPGDVRGRPASPESLTLVFLPLPVLPPACRPTPQSRVGARRSVPPVPSSPPLIPPPASVVTGTPPLTDWDREAERVARAAVAPIPRRPFGMPGSSADAPAPTPEFGWSHAMTHRVESLPSGGFVYNLSERCSIVVLYLPLPVCHFGKPPARGDLFDHLHDAPREGDWRDPR